MEKKKGAFRTSIGGQALIEGILMRGPEKDAIVVRSPEGLVTKVTQRKFVKANYPILGVPILRGAVTFIGSMITGVKALMFSADYFPEDENAKPDKLEEWLNKHVPAEKLQSLLVGFSVVLSIGLMLVLFMLLPTFLAGLFHATTPALHNLIEGVVKILVLLAYMILCSRQKDVYRVFCYHGAEHKTIFCYEAGLPLTVENVRIQPRHHPRCGTSFLFVVIIVSIIVSSLVFPYINWQSVWVRVGVKLLLLVPVVGITYEFNRMVGAQLCILRRYSALRKCRNAVSAGVLSPISSAVGRNGAVGDKRNARAGARNYPCAAAADAVRVGAGALIEWRLSNRAHCGAKHRNG